MPFITLTGGLTLKIPTRSTTDWDQEFLDEFAAPISEHTHTGAGDGAQLGAASISDDALDDRKIVLRNGESLRILNTDGSDTRSLIRSGDLNLINNQAVLTSIADLFFDPAIERHIQINYTVTRIGTDTITQSGMITLAHNGTDFDQADVVIGDAGIDFCINASGQLQYTSTDNAGSSSELMHYTVIFTGE